MRRLLLAIKLHLTSMWSSNSTCSSSNHYDIYSRSMLLLLCRWKDADIMEWEYACTALADICSKMSEQLLSNKSEVEQAVLPNEQDMHSEWKYRFSALEKEFASRDEMRSSEIEKLKNENNWLQHRLSEKLQQVRHQNDIIDELKRDLVESVQQTEISEGRRLCYEHKIKILEEQLDKVTLSKIPETDMFEQRHAECPLQEDQTTKYQEEIARLNLELQYYRNSDSTHVEAQKVVQIHDELVQKKKEIALLQDLVEEQHCHIQTLSKQLGLEDVLNVSHLKRLLGRDLDCNQCIQESQCGS
ncbi:hypothetical protein GWE_04415 [Chlamydia psittaci NJ1]|nr:hypothetical protein GWE_04415 [Chlamydia psittaci NJ1]